MKSKYYYKTLQKIKNENLTRNELRKQKNRLSAEKSRLKRVSFV